MTKENPEREGFTAEELGEQSIYDDATDMQRQMLRGDETKGDPNNRDTAGTTGIKDTNEARQDQDTRPTTSGNLPAK